MFLPQWLTALVSLGLLASEKEREEAQAWLNVIKNMADAQGVDLITEIVEGHMSAEGSIVDYAENNGIDLIVVLLAAMWAML
jgi:nucleotide-binding universal stress UspA family protein